LRRYNLDANLFIAAGEIKSARRAAVESLLHQRRASGAGYAEGLADITDSVVGRCRLTALRSRVKSACGFSA
jgi:hypothetical protein